MKFSRGTIKSFIYTNLIVVTMEIDYNHLRSVFDPLKIRNGVEFEYLGRPFAIWVHKYTKQEREEGNPPIFYVTSTATDGYDIYLPTQLKTKFRKPATVHESVEAIVKNWLDKNSPKTTPREDQSIAHETAKSIDERYAKETLTEQEFQEYLLLKERFGQFIDGG